MNKKISILLLSSLMLGIHDVCIMADTHESQCNVSLSYDDEDFDDFSHDDLNINKDSLKNYVPPIKLRSIETNTDEWAALLLALGNNNIILNQSLYQYTHPIRTRVILDYPFALTYGFDLQEQHALTLNLYANISWPKNFTKNSQLLSSYLNTENQDIIDILDEIAQEFGIENALDFGETFALLSPGKVIELRAGGLLEGHLAKDRWQVNFQLPIQYVARAFYMTPSEKALLFNSPFAATIETSNNINQDQFYYDNFFVDQIGMGDLKIKGMYQIHKSSLFDAYLGGFIIFPIAAALQQGVVGTWIDQNNERQYLDLRTIDPDPLVPLTTQNQYDIAQFFMGAIDKLNSNILYPLLGNNGHAVVACSSNIDWFFTQNWKFSGDYSFEVPLRSTEQRFYKAIQSNGEFTTEFNNAADQSANDLVLFANQKIQDMFFPFVYNTLVWPGIIINSTNQFVLNHEYWNLQLGGNFWYQAKEQITAPVLPSNYDLSIVPAASASQGKLFGQFNYDFAWENNFWSLSAYTDITIWNSGIGNDYTVTISFDYKF